MMRSLVDRVKLRWVIPLVVCYSIVGFLIYAGMVHPETSLVCAITILTTVLLTMVAVLVIN